MKYIIYKITIQDYIYIGSTKNYTRRKCRHKYDCNCNKDILLYNKINELGGWKNSVMTPIEEYECENNIQAHIREEQLRKEYNANLNMVRCHTTTEDVHEDGKAYYIINKDKINQQHKQYYENNKDIRKDKRKVKMNILS